MFPLAMPRHSAGGLFDERRPCSETNQIYIGNHFKSSEYDRLDGRWLKYLIQTFVFTAFGQNPGVLFHVRTHYAEPRSRAN